MTRRIAPLALAAALALTGCVGKTPTASPTVATVLSPNAEAPSPTAAASSTASATSKPGAPKSTAPATQPPTGPHIAFFRIKTKPSCPSSGAGGASFPGGISLEWSALNVDQVTISIDGPGIFGNYDPIYAHDFPFSCEGASGSTQKHTFTLRTVGGGVVKEAKVTGEARVN